MLFNSVVFIPFIAVFFALWPFFRERNLPRYLFLLFFSLLFYGWWDFRYVFLLFGTGVFDWLAGLCMERWAAKKRLILICSLTLNLGLLIGFKYSSFLVQNVNGLALLGFGHTVFSPVEILLPIGISFYVFQSLSYTIDVYRGEIRPAKNLFHFLASLSFFPHLVAGPILRAKNILPQLATWRRPLSDEIWMGLKLCAVGYFKKMVVADTLAPFVNSGYSQVHVDSAVHWWAVTLMFAAQIYADFSGYSDIARGISKLIGYEIPINFNKPYAARSLREFWHRWHISLSSWFRDYVYIPLGGSQRGASRMWMSLWITMLLSGIWHGASWNFLCWGVCHALFLSIEKITGWPEKLKSWPVTSSILLVGQVCVAWVFFRATDISQAFHILSTMLDVSAWKAGDLLALSKTALLVTAAVFACQWIDFNGGVFARMRRGDWGNWLEPVAVGVMMALAIFFRGPGGAFIYFQF